MVCDSILMYYVRWIMVFEQNALIKKGNLPHLQLYVLSPKISSIIARNLGRYIVDQAQLLLYTN